MEETDNRWLQCNACKEMLYRREVERNLKVCPKCNYHFRISAAERLAMVADGGSLVEFDQNLEPLDPLEFKDRLKYGERVKESQQSTRLKEAILCGRASISGQPVMVGILNFEFMGGSMGSVGGEKIARLAERAIGEGVGMILICSSGGARMQEGISRKRTGNPLPFGGKRLNA